MVMRSAGGWQSEEEELSAKNARLGCMAGELEERWPKQISR